MVQQRFAPFRLPDLGRAGEQGFEVAIFRDQLRGRWELRETDLAASGDVECLDINSTRLDLAPAVRALISHARAAARYFAKP